MSTPRLRFAPSPSGYLHVGGARTALFNWLWARKTGGSFVLRVEDTDRERSTDASRAVILESMRWLGLDWDEGPSEQGGDVGAYGPYTQMQRLAIYREWAERLIRDGLAYRCFCTRAELDAQRGDRGFKYPGTCRARTDEPDLPYVIRLATERSGSVVYDDLVFGRIETPNTELQDFVLVRADGVPLYNFGVVVDDITMAITLVARGRDHMVNTPLQILLYRAFGAAIPAFAHLPMMLGHDNRKLSKRHTVVSITEYRDRGYAAGAVIDYIARFGWSEGEHEHRLSRDELVARFDWVDCDKSDGRFDAKKLLAIDHEHLKSARLVGDAEYAEHVLGFVRARGLADVTLADVQRAGRVVRDRAKTFAHAAELLDPLFRVAPVMDEQAAAKFLVSASAAPLQAMRDVLAGADDWTEVALERRLADHGIELKAVGQPARVALTGRTESPGLYDVLALLGRDAAIARLDRGIARALA